MWIFTSKGFLSVVQHKDDADRLIVRARKREHLQELFPARGLTKTPSADYPFRTVVSRTHFKAFMMGQVRNINYLNFKNSIKDADYHDAALTVWATLKGLQLNGR